MLDSRAFDAATCHCGNVVDHFARALDKRYQAVALLGWLWLHADPYAVQPRAHVRPSKFSGLCDASRFRQLIRQLRDVGAVAQRHHKEDGFHVYTLLRPEAFSEETLRHLVRDGVRPPSYEIDEPQTEVKERRQAALKKVGKKRSQVRDVIADMAGAARGELRYSGRGSSAVGFALDWLAAAGSSWDLFLRVCQAAHDDPRQPASVHMLFAPENEGYLAELIESLDSPAATSHPSRSKAPASKTVSEPTSEEGRQLLEAVAGVTGVSPDDEVALLLFAKLDAEYRDRGLLEDEALAHVQQWIALPADSRPSLIDHAKTAPMPS